MGLDAVIYCNCFEKGRLRTPPLAFWNVHVDDYGGRSARTGSIESDLAFDQWNLSACEHESGILLHHRLGNIATIAFLRETLSRYPVLFPIILSRIIHNGAHAGGLISTDEICKLEPELRSLSIVRIKDTEEDRCVRRFESQLRELVDAALRLNKPIVF